MKALVVYESMFGNTKDIAEAIASGLALHVLVDVTEVGAADAEIDDIGLLVVGAPTHAFGLSRPSTRRDAANQSRQGVVSTGTGVREWLAGLGTGPNIAAAAAFDTRIAKPRVPGSAGRAIARRLQRARFRTAAKSQSFYVVGTLGPLMDGELDRARRWGDQLGKAVMASKTLPTP